MKILSTFAASLLLLNLSALAQTTHTWEQSSFDDFEKGTSRGVAIRSDGVLELAPGFRAVATTPSTYIWAVASDTDGNLLAATGGPARVYKVTPQGQLSTLLEPAELQVQAVAVSKDGTIYAATSPDGKIYRIQRNAVRADARADARVAAEVVKPELDAAYTASVFFEPHTKYVWALAVDERGKLYIATGDRGEIYRVEPGGSGALFFKSDEAHIRSIAFDKAGNLIAGSDGSGLVYRISPAGEAFVLYSAPKKEITALAVDAEGNIYAAATGEKRARSNASAPTAESPQSATSTTVTQLAAPGIGATGSEVYRIAPDGEPRRIWQSRDDLVYALAFDAGGRLLAGTGNKGKIYALSTGELRFTDLLKASANQVVSFARAPNGGLWAATSNLGKVFLMQDAAEHEGTFESDVFDAKIFSRWGRMEVRGSGNVELFARSGNVDNPDRNWSAWQKIDRTKEAAMQAPAARFVQWRAVLHSGEPRPQVEAVALNYLPKNVAPEVDEVTVLVGHKFAQAPRLAADVANSTAGEAVVVVAVPQRDRNWIAVRWNAHDENDDQLRYSVLYRGEGERRWQLLKAGLADKFYCFESGLLPDGRYTIRVEASDRPSHGAEDALTGARESAAFDVDNTPPVVSGLTARVDATGIHVSFRASDSYSILRHAEFSVDAGEWQFIAPVGGISDARTEMYEFTVPLARYAVDAGEEHVVVVRVFDRAENAGTAKIVVKGGAR
jgi:outer membrane protein assembly factor BamB